MCVSSSAPCERAGSKDLSRVDPNDLAVVVPLQFVDFLLNLRDPRKLRAKLAPNVFRKLETRVAKLTAHLGDDLAALVKQSENVVELGTCNRFAAVLTRRLPLAHSRYAEPFSCQPGVGAPTLRPATASET